MRFVKPLLIVGIAASLVILLYCTVGWLSEPGDRIHDFLFDRSVVQYVTLLVFALVVTLLGYRLIGHLRSTKELRKIQLGENCGTIPDSPLGRHIRTWKDTLTRQGAGTAIVLAERFAEEREKETQRGYELINFLVCSLPALGLFGTMLGLSSALSVAFSKGSFEKESIQGFVSSLGTALDTTVLALACAMAAGMVVWLLNRIERLFHEQRIEVSYSAAGLSPFALQPRTEEQRYSSQSEESGVLEKVMAKFKASIVQSVKPIAETVSRFDEGVGRLEEFVRTSIEHFARSEAEHDQRTNASFQAIYSHFGEAVVRIGNLIATHNSETTRTIASAINRFAEAIEASNVVDTVRAEIRAGMVENMTEVTSKFDTSLGRLEELMGASIERSTHRQSNLDEENREAVVQAVTSCLTEVLERIGELITTHNSDAVKHVTLALDRFAGAVDERIPQEFVISSQGRRGNGELNHVA